MAATMDRRVFLGLALAGIAGTLPVTGCGHGAGSDVRPDRTPPRPQAGRRRILLAYFSRPGENYWNGGRRNLDVGNTEVLAQTISARLECDVYRIEPVDSYPDSYDETVARNVREQEADARPVIADPLRSIAQYDTVLLAGPIWNLRAPMIMSTFADRYDFAGKTVFPITTYAMSGLGTTPDGLWALVQGRTHWQRTRGSRRGGAVRRGSRRLMATPHATAPDMTTLGRAVQGCQAAWYGARKSPSTVTNSSGACSASQ
jgi:hypothetical protein